MSTGKTRCAAPGCIKFVKEGNFCCLEHWKALPRGLRKKIQRFEHRGLHDALLVARRKAREVWEGKEPDLGTGFDHVFGDAFADRFAL